MSKISIIHLLLLLFNLSSCKQKATDFSLVRNNTSDGLFLALENINNSSYNLYLSTPISNSSYKACFKAGCASGSAEKFVFTKVTDKNSRRIFKLSNNIALADGLEISILQYTDNKLTKINSYRVSNIKVNSTNTADSYAFPLIVKPRESFLSNSNKYGAIKGNLKNPSINIVSINYRKVFAVRTGRIVKISKSIYNTAGSDNVDVVVIQSDNKTAIYRNLSKDLAFLNTNSTTFIKVNNVRLTVGNTVNKNQQIGKLASSDNNKATLYLELYSTPPGNTPFINNANNFQRRKDLIDPTPFINKAYEIRFKEKAF